MDDKIRCDWGYKDDLMRNYHDFEWGRPEHNDRKLFELLILETMQAGLSWYTVLRKREAFRGAFSNFDYREIMRYDNNRVTKLLENPGLIRSEKKIRSIITNSIAFSKLKQEFGSFDSYLLRFRSKNQKVPGTVKDIPARSNEGDELSADLKKRGFSFTGPVMCYSFLQAVGIVNDHVAACFVRTEIEERSEKRLKNQ